ncbi:MAG TPA: hypothetical protein VJ583_10620 [Nitrososphaeraceae archaeon]|nr:hypothetical protein [Nitrososphaeraceae archaeon]
MLEVICSISSDTHISTEPKFLIAEPSSQSNNVKTNIFDHGVHYKICRALQLFRHMIQVGHNTCENDSSRADRLVLLF